jgi:flagellar biosynthesis protein FliP
MPETPPNSVLLSLALFLTALSTGPALQDVAEKGVQPFLDGRISVDQAMERSAAPLRTFMLRQVRDSDLKTVYGISRKPLPAKPADVSMVQLVPAFMLNELRVAFTIGFVILLPFLLIDLVVSAVLLSLGMLMVPPATISLPLKILMFVVIDGWGLLITGVIGSFR